MPGFFVVALAATSGAPVTAPSTIAPLRVVLPLTFLASMSCGTVTTGIFFLTQHGYGFSTSANFLLGLVQGVAYTAGAFFAGRLIARVRAAGIPTRSALLVVLLLLGAFCTLPLWWASPAAVWALMALYSPLNGMLWPLVESYVSGGRSGRDLRRTIGAWNVTWSVALVFSFAAIAPLAKAAPAWALAGLGALHVASTVLLAGLAREPAAHLHERHAVPESYRALLDVFRRLLPLTTFLLNVLSPALPLVFARLGIATDLAAGLAGAWLLPRAIAFFVLARKEGWHGRRSTAVLGAATLVSGFAVALSSGLLAAGPVGITVCMLGLVAYGIGMAVVYKAALYYAMEVGQAEVGAGGTHEALIGLGFAGGPALGLLAAGATSSDTALLNALWIPAAGLAVAVSAWSLLRRR